MSSYMENANTVNRRWFIIDAKDKVVGRVAAVAASILRGKVKPTFTPHADCGDHVIIVNCDKAVFTGNKLDDKRYYRHSGYIGSLRSKTARQMMAANADDVMRYAVKGMLPKNTLGAKSLTRLHTYIGDAHKQQAQKPEVWPFDID
ncbi:MAG: 50S ribosomal protein L13 [Clostridia bacterium]|nr:50S ribosomal protein L13 [Clostridia bacterium]